MRICGKTEDGRLIVGNVFQLYETKGVPLDTIVQQFDEMGYIIDWIDFYESSVKGGWNIKTTLKKIEYSLIDIKEKEYCEEVLKRLRYYISGKNHES